MKIGIAGPMSLDLLKQFLPENVKLPFGYPCPLTAMLICGLVSKGYEVVAYTTSPGIEKPIIIKGTHLSLCIARREPHAARDLFYSERKDLITLMNKEKVDIIHAHWSYEFAWAALNSGIPTLVTVHDHAFTVFKYQSDAYRFMRLIMNTIVLQKSKYVSTISPYLYKLLPQKVKNRTKIIPNFYTQSVEKYYNNNNKKNQSIIMVANGFGKRKNIENGLIAFNIIREKFNNIELRLIGDGMGMNGPAYKFAIDNRLDKGVRFIGPLSYNEVVDDISKALILLHPSREESFGMAVLEAMILGTPVIGGINSGNIPYLLNHGKYGILCNINDPGSIADAVIKLIEGKKIYNTIRKEARLFAKNNFSEDRIINKYIEYYKQIRREDDK